jgi:hypothetical protein
MKKTLMFLMLSYFSNGIAYITVGTDGACDFNNITQAYDDGDADIRITNQTIYTDLLLVNSARTFTGGFNSCFDAENFNQSTTKTIWDGQDSGVILDIQSFNATIALNGFELRNGHGNSPKAGAVSISNNSTIVISNSDIHDNEGSNGGAIYFNSENTSVTILNTRIYNNSATASGGGVACARGHFTMLGDSAIYSNSTAQNGGGIAALIGCSLDIQSGDAEIGFSTNSGIYGNTASQSGGGVYLSSSTMLLTGDASHPASIKLNSAASNGGGIMMLGGDSSVTAINAYIDNNVANLIGGGVYGVNNASFSMSRLNQTCWDNNKCSSISNNIVTDTNSVAGAGYFANGATANISQTVIAHNKASDAAGFSLFGSGQVKLEGNLLINNKQLSGEFLSYNLIKLNDGAGAVLNFSYNTVAKNDVNSIFSVNNITNQQELNIYNSIIWDDRDIISFSGGLAPLISLDSNIVHESQSFQAYNISGNLVQDPMFFNASTDDFHIRLNSSAVDHCDEFLTQSQYNDLNGKLRGVDEASVVNFNGPYDAGAFEINNDIIFSNGFE